MANEKSVGDDVVNELKRLRLCKIEATSRGAQAFLRLLTLAETPAAVR